MKLNGYNDEKVVMISYGLWHSMALTEKGRVFSWGYNINGQLGHNNLSNSNKSSIVLLSNKIPMKKISCGLLDSLFFIT
jgi:alpha-tubulin suppressor-like RCC1 family protein